MNTPQCLEARSAGRETRTPAPCGWGRRARIVSVSRRGLASEAPHSMLGAGNCKEKRASARAFRAPTARKGAAMAAARPLSRTYLDYNATAPLRPEAREAALAAMATTGNPSSVHAEGRAARRHRRRREKRSRASGRRRIPLRHVSYPAAPRRRTPRSIRTSAPGAARPRSSGSSYRRGEHACVLFGHRFPSAEIAPLTR